MKWIGSVIVAPVAAWFLAQLIKTCICWWQEKKLNWNVLFSSGGMPSSHTACVVALCCQVGMKDGTASSTFAIAFVVACVVIYDAIHVRHSVGEQAIAFNQLLEKMYGQNLSDEEKVREVLGHTPLQALVGFGIGLACGFLIPVF